MPVKLTQDPFFTTRPNYTSGFVAK